MGLITLGNVLIAPPLGVDNSTMEALSETMYLFEPKHFIPPFLAHALGTLCGSLIALKITRLHRPKVAAAIGLFFLAGGIAASIMLPAPLWFISLDVVIAYLPMAWLATKLFNNPSSPEPN